MATVTQLADRISNITGLSTDTSSTERAIILAALNDAYQRAVLDSGCYVGALSWSLTDGTSSYTLGSAPTSTSDILQIGTLYATGGGATNEPLRQVSEGAIRDLARGSASSTGALQSYAVLGTQTILFYPTPGAGVTVAGSYVKEPPTLVESSPAAGQETTPTAVRKAFHFSVLVNGALAQIFEYRGVSERMQFHTQMYEAGLQRLKEWTERFGGFVPTPVDGFEYGTILESDQRSRF